MRREILDILAQIGMSRLGEMLDSMGFQHDPRSYPNRWIRGFASNPGATMAVINHDWGGWTVQVLFGNTPAKKGAMPPVLWNTVYEKKAGDNGMPVTDTKQIIELVGALTRGSR